MSSLALDVGGSFIKAAEVKGGAIVSRVVRAPIPTFRVDGFDRGVREIDADQLDAAVFAVLDEVRVSTSDEVWITGQMAGLAFVDEAGRAVAPIVSWQDTRSDRLDGVVSAMGPEVVEALGDGLRIGSPAVTLASMRIEQQVRICSLISYVAGRVAGKLSNVIHTTDAASWGLFDTRRMEWSSRAAAVAGIAMDQLPDVTSDANETLTESAVHVGIGDQQAALLGVDLKLGELSVNLATGCQVSTLARDFSYDTQTRPFIGPYMLHTITHLPAGRIMRDAVVVTFGDDSPASWEAAADEAETESTISTAIEQVVEGITSAAARLKALGRPIVFSGGLVQKFDPLRLAIVAALDPSSYRTFEGDDAALAGLARLAVTD